MSGHSMPSEQEQVEMWEYYTEFITRKAKPVMCACQQTRNRAPREKYKTWSEKKAAYTLSKPETAREEGRQ